MSPAALAIHLLCALALFALSALLTRLMIRIRIIDMPNHRSSHDRPTPKSGGLAIAVAYFAGSAALFAVSEAVRLGTAPFALHLGLALILLAAGLADDLRELTPLAKLAIQVVVAALFALGVATLDRLPIPFLGPVALGPLAPAFTVFWIVAVMNLVNFMDGINGLVSGTVMIAGTALAALAAGADAPFVYLSALVLVGATAGFFVFNFPAGRIFLGDTGSLFLAYILATLAVIGATREGGHLSFYIVPILLAPLLFDAVLTIALRAARGEKLWVAHRDHLYQRLVRAGLSHVRVSALYFGLTIVAAVIAFHLAASPDTATGSSLLLLLILLSLFALWAHSFAKRHGT